MDCDENGFLFAVQAASSSSFSALPGGAIESSYTAQLAYCVNGTTYGICQSGFDDEDAIVACRSFMQFTPGLTISSMFLNSAHPSWFQFSMFNSCRS